MVRALLTNAEVSNANLRILWVKAGKILPVDTGGKIRWYNLLQQLARRHDITFVSYYPGVRDPLYEAELQSRFPGAIGIPIGAAESTAIRAAVHYLSRLPSGAPYAVSKFTARPVRRLVESWLRKDRCDVAVCDFLSASLNFPNRRSVPCVLFQHNVETLLWQRQAAHEPNMLRRLMFRVEAAKMKRYERAALQRFDHIVAVSPQDQAAMRDAVPADRITVVPTGVDLERFRGYAGRDAGTHTVVFLGSMDWEANVDGAEYFCREIWPDILRRVPTARFQIVGRNPAPRVQRLASETVEITGSVPSVVPYLASAAVFVVPLRIGGGTRLKIFEGMAMGRAVVSSSVGAEGLNVTHGRDALLADSPSAFADAVVDLLTNPTRRQALGNAAAELASRYDWSSVVGSFEDALNRARSTRSEPRFAVAGATA